MHALHGRRARRQRAARGRALRRARAVVARALDHHRSFFVRYTADEAAGGDRGLDMHHDASEVTLNVCLGRAFAGAGLRFCGRFGDADHRARARSSRTSPGTRCSTSAGGGTAPTPSPRASGVNLIVWARSSPFHAAAAPGHIDPDDARRSPRTARPTGFA